MFGRRITVFVPMWRAFGQRRAAVLAFSVAICHIVWLAARQATRPDTIDMLRLPNAGPHAGSNVAGAEVMFGPRMRPIESEMQGVFVLPCGNGERAVTSRSSNDADEPGFLEEILDNLCRVGPYAIEFRLVSKSNPGHSDNCGR